MRSFIEIRALISEDPEQLKKLFYTTSAIDDSESTTYASHRKTLDASETDYEVPFGGVTNASIVIILAYQEIEVKLNGTGSPAVPLRPKVATTDAVILSQLQRYDQPGLALWTGEVTSLHITNPSSTAEASFFVALVGEAE